MLGLVVKCQIVAHLRAVMDLAEQGSCSIDTCVFRENWKDVSPLCEIVIIDFDEARARKANRIEIAPAITPTAARQAEQLAFL